MEFDTGRLEGLSRIAGYSRELMEREQKRRPRRITQESPPDNSEISPVQEDDCHQVDDVI